MALHRAISCSLFLALVASCQSSDDGQAVQPPTEEAPAQLTKGLFADHEHDVAVFAKEAILGFRADGQTMRAGYQTHDVAIRDGIVELTPHQLVDGRRTDGGTMALQTGAIARGDGTVISGGGAARIEGDGTASIPRGEVLEQISNREDGIEQEWRFDVRPEGEGSVTVEVAVTGASLVASNGTGLHFQTAGGLGFKYGKATFVDNLGAATDVATTFEDGYIKMQLPEDLLENAAYPATLDPTVTAEVAVDVPVTGGFTGANANQASVAFDGTNYLVVWADQRISGVDSDVFAARVSQTGTILDTNGIKIASAQGDQLNPSVAFAKGNFVVAWEDFKVDGGAEADIAAATVSSTGVVTSLGVVANTATSETEPVVIGTPTSALLAWNANGDIRGALLTGATFSAPFDVAAQAAISEVDPAVAVNPAGNYLVAWSEGTTSTADLRGTFVTPAGAVGTSFNISAGAGRQFQPFATFDGTNFDVAWTTNNSGNKIFAARVDATGAVLDTHPEATGTVGGIQVSVLANTQPGNGVSCVAGSCLVTYQRRNAAGFGDIFGQRIDITATPFTLQGTEITVSNAVNTQATPATATNGTDYFAVWNDSRVVSPQTVFGARVTGAGSVTDANGILIPLAANNRESTVDVGVSATTHAVAWTDSRSFGTDIELSRFKSTTKLDTTAHVISNGAASQNAPHVSQAATGNYLVVWADSRNGIDRDIFASRVDINGVALDAAGLAINTTTRDQLTPDVATDGTNFFVVWEDRRSGGNFDIFGALVSGVDGHVILNDIAICTQPGDQLVPSVTYDKTDSQFVVVWTDERISSDPNIFGARISNAGAVLDVDGVSVSSASGGQFNPQIAFAGGKMLAVWEDRRSDPAGDIFGARLTGGAALTVLDTTNISIGSTAGAQTEPAVANIGASGGSFIVVWTDGRNVAVTGTDIFAQQVGVSLGDVGSEFLVSGNPENETSPALGDSNSAGTTRVAYIKQRADLQTSRVETRQIKTVGDLGEACGGAGSCGSGFCVDGKCCENACAGGTTDCQACAFKMTGQPDGLCRPEKAGIVCRKSANGTCDIAEVCDGTTTTCGPDLGKNAGKVCNTTTHTVCPANDATGAPHICP